MICAIQALAAKEVQSRLETIKATEGGHVSSLGKNEQRLPAIKREREIE